MTTNFQSIESVIASIKPACEGAALACDNAGRKDRREVLKRVLLLTASSDPFEAREKLMMAAAVLRACAAAAYAANEPKRVQMYETAAAVAERAHDHLAGAAGLVAWLKGRDIVLRDKTVDVIQAKRVAEHGAAAQAAALAAALGPSLDRQAKAAERGADLAEAMAHAAAVAGPAQAAGLQAAANKFNDLVVAAERAAGHWSAIAKAMAPAPAAPAASAAPAPAAPAPAAPAASAPAPAPAPAPVTP